MSRGKAIPQILPFHLSNGKRCPEQGVARAHPREGLWRASRPGHRSQAPYLVGSDTPETSSGLLGASESGASISAQEDRGEKSLGVLAAKRWESAVGWCGGGVGEGPLGAGRRAVPGSKTGHRTSG